MQDQYIVEAHQSWEDFNVDDFGKLRPVTEAFERSVTEKRDEAIIVDGNSKEVQTVYYIR